MGLFNMHPVDTTFYNVPVKYTENTDVTQPLLVDRGYRSLFPLHLCQRNQFLVPKCLTAAALV